MVRMRNSLKEGSLFQVVRSGTLTLCRSNLFGPPALRELPAKEFEVYTHPSKQSENIFQDLEGKVGLVVYIARNRLEQPLGYRVLIEGHEMFCKSKVADKYFKLMGTQGDESR